MDNRAFINGDVYDVTTPENYRNRPELYDGQKVAVSINGYVIPIRNIKYDNTVVGMYPGNVFDRYVMPESDFEKDIYNSSDHMADYNNITKIQELVEEQNKISTDQMMFLTNPDNIFKPPIDNVKDEPLMIGLKQAVIAKNIDINKYQSRFEQFSNDRRMFKKNKISLDKAVTFAKNLDMKATVILEDAHPNVPNPMGRKIIIDLIQPGGDE
jgi:hypothetical protein